jgi:hypothetical protein
MNMKPSHLKNPSACNQQKNTKRAAFRQHRLPQARCSFRSLFFPPIAAEGRFKGYFVNSPLEIAIAEPSVNGLQVFLNQIVSA